MLPLSYYLPTFIGQLNQTQKVGEKVIFADYSKGSAQYTDVTGGQKKKVTFQEILNYGSQLGGLAVSVINALKSPPTTSTGLGLSGLSAAEQGAVGDLKAIADGEQKRKQRQMYLIGGVVLLVGLAALLLLKSKK